MIDARAIHERVIAASRAQLFEAIANFVEYHPRLLPPNCVDFRVLTGGYGMGTEYAFDFVTRRTTTRHHYRVSEPIRGKVITSFNIANRSLITWRIRELTRGCTVQIEVVWPTRSGWSGIYDQYLLPIVVRRLLDESMDRLQALAPTIEVPERPVVEGEQPRL